LRFVLKWCSVTGSINSLLSNLWKRLVQIVIRVHDRREEKRAGVLWVVAEANGEPAPSPAGDPDLVLGYAEHASTVFYPDFEETQGAAHRLVREGPPDLNDSRDVHVWDTFNLGDPAVRDRFRRGVTLGRILARTQECIYCGSFLRRAETADLRWWAKWFGWRYETKECTSCGWWCVSFRRVEGFVSFDELDYWHTYAVMRRFDPLALDTPLSLARGYLSRNPHKLARFDPFHFEALMADCLRDYFGDGEIIKIGGRNDRGIDIKVVRAGGQKLLVQVKRRSDFSRREGVEAVRTLHGVMLREGVPRGMVITTARSYTSEAKREVKQASRNLQGYSMDLLSYDDVVDLLGEPVGARRLPWEGQGIRTDRPMADLYGCEEWIERSILPPPIRQLY
jgi:hypothetical protein